MDGDYEEEKGYKTKKKRYEDEKEKINKITYFKYACMYVRGMLCADDHWLSGF